MCRCHTRQPDCRFLDPLPPVKWWAIVDGPSATHNGQNHKGRAAAPLTLGYMFNCSTVTKEATS